jgi:hypothetical protein
MVGDKGYIYAEGVSRECRLIGFKLSQWGVFLVEAAGTPTEGGGSVTGKALKRVAMGDDFDGGVNEG